MITIYHLGNSQSERVVWLMEELALPYCLEWFDRTEEQVAPEEYWALHPVGTAPVIKDGELVLSESVAVVEYISHKYGNGRLSVAPDHPNFADYLYWMQFNNSIQAVFLAKFMMGNAPDENNPLVKHVVRRREQVYYKYLNDHLGNNTYLAGDEFSCADIMMMFNLTTLPLHGCRGIDGLPNVQRYVDLVSQRPAYIKAMSIAGPHAKKPA